MYLATSGLNSRPEMVGAVSVASASSLLHLGIEHVVDEGDAEFAVRRILHQGQQLMPAKVPSRG